MAKLPVLGNEVVFLVGTIPVSCAEEISLDITIAELAASCVGSGGIEVFRPGKKTIKGSVKGIAKIFTSVEASTNFSFEDWVDGIMDDTELTIVFKGTATGEFIYTLTGYTTSFKISANHNDISKYDASFRLNTLTRTAVA